MDYGQILPCTLLLALACQGLHRVTRKDGPLGVWQSLPSALTSSALLKPITECAECMASFWSLFLFTAVGWLAWQAVIGLSVWMLVFLFIDYLLLSKLPEDQGKVKDKVLGLAYMLIFFAIVLLFGQTAMLLVVPLAACGINGLLERIIEALEAP